MNRRRFVQTITAGAGALVSAPALMFPRSARAQQERRTAAQGKRELAADVIIVGGGMGGWRQRGGVAERIAGRDDRGN